MIVPGKPRYVCATQPDNAARRSGKSHYGDIRRREATAIQTKQVTKVDYNVGCGLMVTFCYIFLL